MKLGELTLVYDALEHLFRCDLPARTAYELSKVIEPVRKEVNHLEKMRLSLLERHTVENEINKEDFLADFNHLLDGEFEIDLKPIPVSQVLESKDKMSALELNVLLMAGILVED